MHIMILTDAIGGQATKDEADTLAQVTAVKRALRRLGHSVEVGYFSLNLIQAARRIQASGCDLVFNLVENLASSRLLHLVPLLCQSIGVRCSGGSSTTLCLSGDKVEAKRLLSLKDLPTPDWIESGDQKYLRAFLNIPMIIKARAQEASVGITEDSVRTFSHIRDFKALFEEGDVFIEEYIEGREFNLSILPGGVVLPPAEILFVDYPATKTRVVGYEAKWEEDSFAYQNTRRTFTFTEEDTPLINHLTHLAQETYDLFGSSGYARVDFRVDRHGRPYILELNSNPCIAVDSGFVAAGEQAGYSYERLIEALITEA
ncbi:MAG: hypothetical protein M0Q37_09405 [Sphaerochaeta sp.]|nr:hypothetical protein [Sphaerochaeta sp.]